MEADLNGIAITLAFSIFLLVYSELGGEGKPSKIIPQNIGRFGSGVLQLSCLGEIFLSQHVIWASILLLVIVNGCVLGTIVFVLVKAARARRS